MWREEVEFEEFAQEREVYYDSDRRAQQVVFGGLEMNKPAGGV